MNLVIGGESVGAAAHGDQSRLAAKDLSDSLLDLVSSNLVDLVDIVVDHHLAIDVDLK